MTAGRGRSAALLAALLSSACAVPQGGYPGTASVAAGAPPVVRIDRTGSTRTDPATLYVPPGTEVTWRNETTRQVFVRFDSPIDQVCGNPARFARSTDGRSFASEFLGPFEEARLCLVTPGRYDFIVSITEPARSGPFVPRDALPPAKYGTVVVTESASRAGGAGPSSSGHPHVEVHQATVVGQLVRPTVEPRLAGDEDVDDVGDR
ncbi:MAG TPA: hypothetical protein VIM86_14410 [Thermodesulfobacteriota bacterium]